RQAEQLFLQALRDGVPTVGHCLGGQLMAKALGAAVTPLSVPEIGWHAIQLHGTDLARHWLGEADRPTVFQWHYESFGLPPGAQLLASSRVCPNQAFAVGPHLAMQWHVELDKHKLGGWSEEASVQDDKAANLPPTVQTASVMLLDAKQHLARQQALADHIYSRWLQALRTA
ncbi:MAG: type 1 glutamine amidotransferase, partial [Rubrivivax sp.]|nr:type 1 glutamine amidotransferase [Rubrivivax sp.]